MIKLHDNFLKLMDLHKKIKGQLLAADDVV
jgi:hypothetical protein